MAEFDIDVLAVAPSFPPAFAAGGPAKSLFGLCQSTPTDIRVGVLTSDRDAGLPMGLSVPANVWLPTPWGALNYCSTGNLVRLVRSYRTAGKMRPSILYINSFFNFPLSILPQLLRRCGWLKNSLVILAPRGEFDPGALALKPGKKRLFLALYRLLRLDRDVVWHVTSEREDTDVRTQWGTPVTTILSENVTLYEHQPRSPDDEFSPPGTLAAIFIGRVSPKKGLHIALDAAKTISDNVTIDVYGPEADAAYSKKCRGLAGDLPTNVTVTFHGATPPEQLSAVYASADVLLMPTAGENFGHVIAESLSLTCPVLVADTTPWSALITEKGAGAVVEELNPAAWSDAIHAYASLSPAEKRHASTQAGEAFRQWSQRQTDDHLFTKMMMGIKEGSWSREKKAAPR